ELFCLVACSIDDLPVFEFESNPIKSDSLIDARRVKRHVTLDRISDWRAEYFAVGNIAIPATDHGWNSFFCKSEMSARSRNLHSVRLFHQTMERSHSGQELAIIKRAHIEIEIFKCLGAHAGKLCHGRSGPAQHDPLCF